MRYKPFRLVRPIASAVLAITLVFGMFAVSGAQAKVDGPTKPADQAKPEEPKKDPKVEEYEKAVKDLKKIEGAFNFYLRKRDVLLELPESMLDKLICMQATFNTGGAADPAQAGSPIGDFGVEVYKFRRQEDAVWLVKPPMKHRWSKDDSMSISSERSFPEAILSSFRIEQTHPEKKLLLVNITSLFYGDVLQLGQLINMGIGGAYSLDREKCFAESVKSFPENSVVRMQLHWVSQPGGGNPLAALIALLGGGGNNLEDARSFPVKVTYNLWPYKKSDYMPRLFDPRVGYFTQDFYNVEKLSDRDRTERYIIRWDLKKKDPTATQSEPVKPIVWTIDPSIPQKYRQGVRDGILYWNKAFESIGLKNAMQVQDAPNDPDYDHADGRYNVIRMTMTEDAGYAIALPRTDPFSGEIINAAVNLDGNMLPSLGWEYKLLVQPAVARYDALQAFKIDPAGRLALRKLFHFDDPVAAKMEEVSAKFGSSSMMCSMQRGLMESARFAYSAMAAFGKKLPSEDDYINQFLRDVVSHEVGHTLGLRHNFIASTNLTTAQLEDDACVQKNGLSASVMDYTPVNIMSVVGKGTNFYTPTIGPYDMWAIKYGYMNCTGTSPEGEKFELSRVAAQSGAPGNRYMTDEDADSFDPCVLRFDNAKDSINYCQYMMSAAQKIRDYAITNLPKHGEPYAKRTEQLMIALNQNFRQSLNAARYVGGILGNRNYRGDIGEKPTLQPAPADQQRQAVRLIVKNVLSKSSLDIPDNVLMNMSLDYAKGSGSGNDMPLRQQFGMRISMLYAVLMGGSTTERICENEFKWNGSPNSYGIAEHFGTVIAATFSEIGKSEKISPLRRDLQRFAVDGLFVQAGAAQGQVADDVRVLADDTLRRLKARIDTQLKMPKNLDAMTIAHLRDLQASIERFHARQLISR